MLDITAPFPLKLGFLFEPAPYKVAYGGRGAAKSWGFARALLILGARKPLRILCAREIQTSLEQSVHQLLCDQISMLGLDDFYDVTGDEIRGANGTAITFRGLQGTRHKVRAVKSTERLDIIWVEEGDAITKKSWDTVIPTLRQNTSELWITFNPELASDETYKRFVLTPPPGAIVVKMSWRDNPWFSDRQNNDRLHMEATDPDGYLHVWEGQCRVALEGAVFAKELRDATAQGRIGRVPYDPRVPVFTFWDLGWSDLTAIWMGQKVGFEYHLIDYLEDSQKDAPAFIKELDAKGYIFGTHFLPHDAANKVQAAKGLSISRQIRDLKRQVKIQPRLPVATQISYARQVFPLCHFDEAKTAPGIERLRRFKYEVDDDSGERDRLPAHDINSHGASAFMGFAASIKHVDKKDRPKETPDRSGLAHPEFGDFVTADAGQGWMR